MSQPVNTVAVGDHGVAKAQRRERLLPVIYFLSGATAGGIEATITYPFEFAKTSLQLETSRGTKNPLALMRHVVRTNGVRAIYTGCSSLIIGTMLKGGVRFFAYDSIKSQMEALSPNSSTFLRGVLAGMGAGVAESVLAVTPTERIKTALIDGANSGKGIAAGGGARALRLILTEQGISGLYKGLLPTTLKQSMTSAVRMGSYNMLKETSKKYEVPQNALVTFLMGAVAGVITVYTTQPFDSVKTRSQALAGQGTVQAFRSIVRDSGVRGFWSGSTMRLGRLVLSGGIVFTVYDQVRDGLEKAML